MKKRIFLNKSNLISVLIVLAGVFCCSCKKTIKVAYCNLSEDITSSINDVLTQNQNIKYKFSYLNIGDISQKTAQKITKKNDLIFSMDGNINNLIQEYTESIPNEVYSNIPDRIAVGNTKKLPILLNHYGISYCDSIRQSLELKYPGSFEAFEVYLDNVCKDTDYPIFVAGAEDENLLAFITALCESFGGKEGYDSFINLCKRYSNEQNFNELLNAKIINNYYFVDILNLIADWQKKGYLSRGWLNLNTKDFKAYARDYNIGSAFLSLGQYHSLDYKIAQDYSCDRFPVKDFDLEHGIIAPEVVCFCTNNKVNINNILKSLVSSETQEELSEKTMLAPVSINGTAYDRVSDDVRFLASSCDFGPLSDCYNQLLGNNDEGLKKFAEEIRVYLKK